MLAKSGVELIQYRNKTASSRSLLQTSRKLVAALSPRGVRYIVNDRPDVALLARAVACTWDTKIWAWKTRARSAAIKRWVGISTHTLEQLAAADRTSADYIAFGPIFPTLTKQNPDTVVGTDLLRRARQLTRKPLVAIGGITRERAAEVYDAGADSLAVARDLIQAVNPGARVREYLEVAASAKSRESAVRSGPMSDVRSPEITGQAG